MSAEWIKAEVAPGRAAYAMLSFSIFGFLILGIVALFTLIKRLGLLFFFIVGLLVCTVVAIVTLSKSGTGV